MSSAEFEGMLKEMLIINTAVSPTGMIGIGKRGSKDLLRDLMVKMGFEFMVMTP